MIATTEGETMKDRIDKYIKKKKREAALKIIKDNLPAILCVLGVILALIVFKIIRKKAKKKVKAKIKEARRERREARKQRELDDGWTDLDTEEDEPVME